MPPESGARAAAAAGASAGISISPPMRPSASHTVGAVYGKASTAAMHVAKSFDGRRAFFICPNTSCTGHHVNPSLNRKVPVHDYRRRRRRFDR